VGGAVIASGLVAAAIALPWLTLLPLPGGAAVIAHALTLVAAFHGAGLVVAGLAGQPSRVAGPGARSPWLAFQWGAAALIGLSGLAIAAGVGTLATHAVLVFGSVAVHTGNVGLRFTSHVARVEESLAGPHSWLVPAALLAGLGTLAVLAAAADPLAQPFDDDGHVVAQLRRVLDTGALGDPIGYPRSTQLGAQIALAAVASGAGDGFARIVDALAMMLALGLAVSRIGGRDPGSALWAVILIAAAFALALAPGDPLPCWTAVGLTLALYAMLSDTEPAPALPLAITAGALIALRHELAPIAAVAVIAAWWSRRTDHRRTAVLLGGVCGVSLPFVVARMLAWRSVPLIAHAAGPPELALVLRLALAAAIAAPAACVLRLALPDSRALRWAALATVVALGAIAAQVTGAGPYSRGLAWPIAIAFAITVAVELARTRWSGPAALVTSLVLCVVVAEGRAAPGPLRWSHRLADATTTIAYLAHPPAEPPEPYSALLASVPTGATVAVWVIEPERLDYADHRIIDLRTPAGARLRGDHWSRDPANLRSSTGAALEAVLAALPTSFLLIEDRDARAQSRGPTSALFHRLACQTLPAVCADDLEAIARRHRTIAQHGPVRLVELGR
jgi:hypothetical protein